MKRLLLAAALAASLAAVAQPYGPGTGTRPGMGPGQGQGPGMHGGPRFGTEFTPGWALMTPQERTAHQEKMRGAKTYDECVARMTEHHKLMQARAAEKGSRMRWDAPLGRGCEYLKK